MKYLQFTQYLYVLIAVFLFYKGFTMLDADNDEKWLYFILGAMCIVMFFVRRKIMGRIGQDRKP